MNPYNLLYIDHLPEMALMPYTTKGIEPQPIVNGTPDLDLQEFYAFEDRLQETKGCHDEQS